MAVTPEGKIKKLVRKVLDEFSETVTVDDFVVKTLKQYWPVPSGFGTSDIDCIVCYYGFYISIETKAPGKKPTPRQNLTLAETKAAGGAAFVIDSVEGVAALRDRLQRIKSTMQEIGNALANNRQR